MSGAHENHADGSAHTVFQARDIHGDVYFGGNLPLPDREPVDPGSDVVRVPPTMALSEWARRVIALRVALADLVATTRFADGVVRGVVHQSEPWMDNGRARLYGLDGLVSLVLLNANQAGISTPARARVFGEGLGLPVSPVALTDAREALAAMWQAVVRLGGRSGFGSGDVLRSPGKFWDVAADMGGLRPSEVASVRERVDELRVALRRVGDVVGVLLVEQLAVVVSVDGADLTGVVPDVLDLGLLTGIEWTAATRWSDQMSGPVREQSEKRMPGVFRVR